VDVIALRQRGQSCFESYRGVNLHRIQKRVIDERNSKFAYLFRLLRFLSRSFWVIAWGHLRRHYDLVHVHSVPDFEVFAAIVPRIFGAKIILDIHDIVPEFYCSKFKVNKESVVFRLLVAVERASIAFAHHTIVANDIWRERLLSRSASPDRCSTMMNYPDPAIFRERERQRKDGRFVVLYPGTINYHQGIDLAVRAFALLRTDAPLADFHIYGDGPDREAVEQLVRDLSLQQRVFIHDLVPITQVAEIMSEADLGVVPKRRDSFGDEAFSTKSLEFMALGVPIVMANTTIDTRYFNSSVVAFFESGSEEDLARVILHLYRDRDALRDLAAQAKLFVAQHTWDKKKGDYFELLISVL
jgi:glycosyltransferase involved in cell wall biosynthesis